MAKTDWPVKTLGEVATISTGKIDVNAATENGAYPFFTCSRDVYRIDDAPFEGKAILVAGNGDLNVKYYEGRFNVYQRTYFLFARDENSCNPRYLFWFLENHLDVLRSGASGSTIKYIRLGDLSEASIAVPPLAEQKRIVERLDAATARVTELTACYEQARTHADNLFTSALRAALEGNSDWPVKTLDDLCDIYQPQTIGMKDLIADGKYIVYGANGPIGRYDRFNHEKSEVTVTCRGATCGTVNVTPPEVWITGNAMVVRPNEMKMSKEMMRYVLEGLDYSQIITGAAQPQITRQTLAPSTIKVPPLEEQKKIVAHLDSMRAKTSEMVAAYDAKLTAAKNLRQSILEAAFAGDL